ncbi:MAG: PH domain-containing protein [Actinomycetota bacterium]
MSNSRRPGWLRNPLTWIVPIFVLLIFPGGIQKAAAADSDVVPMIVGFVLCLALSVKFALAGARAEERGLRVRNVLRAYFIPWADIDGKIILETWRILPGIPTVHLRDGRRIPIIGLSIGSPIWNYQRRQAARWLTSLNTAVDSARRPADQGVKTHPSVDLPPPPT